MSDADAIEWIGLAVNEEEIIKASVGDIVKLAFKLRDEETKETCREWMWVKVTSIDIDENNENLYTGTLDSIPYMCTTLEFDDVIDFNVKNIMQIY